MRAYEVNIVIEIEEGRKITFVELVTYPGYSTGPDGAVSNYEREERAVNRVKRRTPWLKPENIHAEGSIRQDI